MTTIHSYDLSSSFNLSSFRNMKCVKAEEVDIILIAPLSTQIIHLEISEEIVTVLTVTLQEEITL